MSAGVNAPTSGFIRSGNTRIHYLDWGGTGPAVLLLHGLGGRSTGWTDAARVLSGEFRVIAPDLRGHGRSDKPDRPYTLDAYAQDISALMAELDLGPLMVAGHSLGGRIALALAANCPDRIGRIIVEEGHPTARPGAARAYAQKMAAYPVPFPSREEGIAFIRERRGEGSAKWYSLSLEAGPEGGAYWAFSLPAMIATAEQVAEQDHWSLLGRVQCPVLLLYGTNSAEISPALAARMKLGLRDCTVVPFAGAGHWIHGEFPEAYSAVVLPFLNGRTT